MRVAKRAGIVSRQVKLCGAYLQAPNEHEITGWLPKENEMLDKKSKTTCKTTCLEKWKNAVTSPS